LTFTEAERNRFLDDAFAYMARAPLRHGAATA
jgi:hypothetical protein